MSSPSFPLVIVGFGGCVFALEPTTGRRAWSHEANATGKAHIVRVAVIGERVFVAPLEMEDGRELHVLDYRTGRLLARAKVPYAVGRTMMAVDGQLYLGGNGGIACYSLDTGALLWSDDFGDKNSGTVSIGVPGYSVQGDVS